MFVETKRRVTKVKGAINGQWLQEVIEALGISHAELADDIGANLPARLYQHIRGASPLGGDYLSAIKIAHPSVNLNYLLVGELPILLKPTPDADKLREKLNTIRDITTEGI